MLTTFFYILAAIVIAWTWAYHRVNGVLWSLAFAVGAVEVTLSSPP